MSFRKLQATEGSGHNWSQATDPEFVSVGLKKRMTSGLVPRLQRKALCCYLMGSSSSNKEDPCRSISLATGLEARHVSIATSSPVASMTFRFTLPLTTLLTVLGLVSNWTTVRSDSPELAKRLKKFWDLCWGGGGRSVFVFRPYKK
jgi:hypothetical protein